MWEDTLESAWFQGWLWVFWLQHTDWAISQVRIVIYDYTLYSPAVVHETIISNLIVRVFNKNPAVYVAVR